MATPDEILTQKYIELATSLSSGNKRLKDALMTFVGANDKLADAYVEKLKTIQGWTTKEAQAAKARLIRLNDIAKQKDKIDAEAVKAASDYKKQIDKMRDNTVIWNSRLAALSKDKSLASKIEQDRIRDLKRDQSSAMASLRYNNKQSKLIRDNELKIIAEATKERDALEKHQAKLSTRLGQSIRESLSGALEKGVTKVFAPEQLGASLKEGYNYIVEAAATQGGMSLDQMFKAASMGLSPTDFVKLQAQYRQTEVAMVGGQQAFIDGMAAGRDAYTDMVVDSGERTKLIASQFDVLTKSGIRPSVAKLAGFSETLHKVSLMTGKSAQAITTDLATIQEDESTQTLLKMATSESERLAIIQSTQAVYANNVAMGMSTKQAINAATQLNKLQTQTAKSRITEAARIRVLGGALGMGTEAAELAAIRTKGPRATKEEQEKATAISAAISEKITQAKGGENLGMAMTVESLSAGLKLEDQFGPSSPFNNTLGAAIKPLENSLVELDKTIPKATAEAASAINDGLNFYVKNPLFTGFAGLLGMMGASNLLLGAIAAATAATAAGGIGGAAGGMLGKAGKVLKGAGIVGGVIGAGYNVIEGVGNVGTKGKEGAGYGQLAGTAVGGLVGLFGGPAGALLGATIGGQIGKYVGEWASTPTKDKNIADTNESAKKTVDATQRVKEATEKTSDSISAQLLKMETANSFLKTISENSTNSVTLSEKMLVALSLSDKERSSSENRSKLLKDNRFGSTYGYVS